MAYHLRVSNFLKSGSPNHLEPSGPVQACNGIALPLLYLQNILCGIVPGHNTPTNTYINIYVCILAQKSVGTI